MSRRPATRLALVALALTGFVASSNDAPALAFSSPITSHPHVATATGARHLAHRHARPHRHGATARHRRLAPAAHHAARGALVHPALTVRASALSTLIGTTPAAVAPATATAAAATTTTTAATAAATSVSTAATGPQLGLGVLLADPRFLTSDQAAGVRTAVVESRWDDWMPSENGPDANYIASRAAQVQAYRAAGFTVSVDPGLQHPPAWLLAKAGSQLQAQDGSLSGTPNFEYSAQVRAAAAAYLTTLVQSVGPVDSIRVGLNRNGEALLPESAGQWWAYGEQAQQGGSDLAPGATASPMPGWVPGQGTYNGATVTADQVQAWYSWYLDGSISALQWEMSTLRAAGHGGMLDLVIPGDGAEPWVLRSRLADGLADAPFDPYHTVNTAAVWQVVIPRLAGPNVRVDISSVADDSGVGGAAVCAATDAVQDPASVDVTGWSSTRWLSLLAARSGLPVEGESTGNNSTTDADRAFMLARGCHLGTLLWAWDYQLYDGVHVPISYLATEMTQH